MFEQALPALMFIAGAALLTWLMVRRSFRRLGPRNRKSDSRPIDAQPRPTDPWSGAHRDAAAVLERQKVELAEFARDTHGQIDTKILVLRELIAQSERQIERLERLLAETKGQVPSASPRDESHA